MALLNELLEQASREAAALEKASQASLAGVRTAVEEAEAVAHLAVEKGEAHYGALSVLAQSAEHIADELKSPVLSTARDALKGVGRAASRVAERADVVLEEVEKGTLTLAQQRADIQAGLDLRLEEMRASFAAMHQKLQEFGAATAEQTAAAQASMAVLHQSLADTLPHLRTATDSFLESMDAAGDSARVETKNCRRAIQSLSREQTIALVALANTMVDTHNVVVVDVRKRLTEELPAKLWRAMGTLREAAQELHEIREDGEPPLDVEAEEIERTLSAALFALDRIRAFADEIPGL